MAQVMKDIVTWLKQWFYTESEVDTITGGLQTQINNKADTTTVTSLTTTVGTKADKTGGVQQITDSNAHTNLGTSANASQGAINTAIDTMIGNLVSTELIVVVTTLPTASASTMNKIYCVTGGSESTNKFTEYLTVKDGSTYSWEKIGEISSGSLTVDWADVLNKPSTFTPSSHNHDDRYYTETEVDGLLDDKLDSADYVVDSALSSSSTNPVQNNVINTALSGKAPTNHSSGDTTYGVGTTGSYGHCKTVNDLSHSSHSNGLALSAYQGYVLNTNKSSKTETININNITLVDKGEENEGCIIFNTIS